MKARWKRIKSSTFKCDIQKWYTVMTVPINNEEMFKIEKKRVSKYFNNGFTDWLKKKWSYSEI
jgi:hypothetical protein